MNGGSIGNGASAFLKYLNKTWIINSRVLKLKLKKVYTIYWNENIKYLDATENEKAGCKYN